MGLVDHESSIKVPYSVEDTYKALKDCANMLEEQFKVERFDDLIKTVYLKAGVSLFSWGENITVTIKETSDGMSEINALSTPKTGMMLGGSMDMGKNRKNLNIIMSYLSEELKKYTKVNPNSNSNSITDKIKQLSTLKEEGLITEEEYINKKQELLSQL